MLGPRGDIMPRPLSALEGSPFDSYLRARANPVRRSRTRLARGGHLIWLRHPLAPVWAIVVGVVVLIWIAVEIAIIGYSNDPPLRSIYLLLGAVITVVGLGWLRETSPSASRRG